MANELICMNIYGQNMMLQSFPPANIDEEKEVMSLPNAEKLWRPLYHDEQGCQPDEVRELMSWVEHNVAHPGKVAYLNL